MIQETVGDFWFTVLSILAIVGPLAVFSIIFAVAKSRGYKVAWVVVTIILCLVAIAFALAFMFTQWTISTEPFDADPLATIWGKTSPIGWTGFGIIVTWVVGGLLIALAVDEAK